MNLFISYARADGIPMADRLRADLETAGYSVWQDVNAMRGGQAWEEQIGAALGDVGAVLLLLSPGALASKNVRWEWTTAKNTLNKPVIPLMIIPCNVPPELARIHYHNFTDPDKSHHMKDKLIRDLRDLEAKTMSDSKPDQNSGGSKYNFQNSQIENSAIGDNAQVFNISGDVKGANVNLGGKQNFQGDASFSYSEGGSDHELITAIQALAKSQNAALLDALTSRLDAHQQETLRKIQAALDAGQGDDDDVRDLLDDMRVRVGDRVVRGQQIANVGNADGNFAYHLHFDLSHTSKLETNPGDWPKLNLNSVLTDYVDPREFIAQNRPNR